MRHQPLPGTTTPLSNGSPLRSARAARFEPTVAVVSSEGMHTPGYNLDFAVNRTDVKRLPSAGGYIAGVGDGMTNGGLAVPAEGRITNRADLPSGYVAEKFLALYPEIFDRELAKSAKLFLDLEREGRHLGCPAETEIVRGVYLQSTYTFFETIADEFCKKFRETVRPHQLHRASGGVSFSFLAKLPAGRGYVALAVGDSYVVQAQRPEVGMVSLLETETNSKRPYQNSSGHLCYVCHFPLIAVANGRIQGIEELSQFFITNDAMKKSVLVFATDGIDRQHIRDALVGQLAFGVEHAKTKDISGVIHELVESEIETEQIIKQQTVRPDDRTTLVLLGRDI